MKRTVVIVASVALAFFLGPAAAGEAPGFKALHSNTVGVDFLAPVLGEASLSVDQQVHLGTNSAVFKDGEPFLWDEKVFVSIYFGSTALGRSALASLTTGDPNATSGVANTAVGFEALTSTTSGLGNTAVGDRSMRLHETGISNTAIGVYSLPSLTSGNFNTALGGYAMWNRATGDKNTAGGFASLAGNTGGSLNTALGYKSLYGTGGSNGTALGANALRYSSGQRNIALGYAAGKNLQYAGGSTGDFSDNIFIGHQGETSDRDTIRIGVQPAALGSPADFEQNRTFIAGIFGQTVLGASDVPVLIDANGQLGTVASSRRYKEDIRDMGSASSGVLDLRPVTFRYRKAGASGDKPVRYGLIAEEVIEIFPELVVRDAADQPQTIKYHLLPAMLLNELQKQQALIHEQQRRIERLEALALSAPVRESL